MLTIYNNDIFFHCCPFLSIADSNSGAASCAGPAGTIAGPAGTSPGAASSNGSAGTNFGCLLRPSNTSPRWPLTAKKDQIDDSTSPNFLSAGFSHPTDRELSDTLGRRRTVL